MMTRITTHVLDTARGCGGGHMEIGLRRVTPDPADLVRCVLDAEGRAMVAEGDLPVGTYELLFEVGAYYAGTDTFLDIVPVRFIVAGPEHYHIPLILSPFGYSTYRGG